MQAGPHRPRQNERKPILLVARCRRTLGATGNVSITDLTAEGCCISGGGLHVGQGVTIKPELFEALAGTVRWVSADEAGVEFDRPLYGAVAEHLQQEYGTFGAASPSPPEGRPSYRRI